MVYPHQMQMTDERKYSERVGAMEEMEEEGPKWRGDGWKVGRSTENGERGERMRKMRSGRRVGRGEIADGRGGESTWGVPGTGAGPDERARFQICREDKC